MRLSSLLCALALTGCSLAVGSARSDEMCANGVDDDFDGRIDCADVDCTAECPDGDVDEPDLLGTCSRGWGSSRDGAYCEPWAAMDWTGCGTYTFRPPTASGCVMVGDEACEIPTSALLPGNLFVDARAEPRGEGTLESPYASLDEALAVAELGATIVFAGEHEVSAPITQFATLKGLCPRLSTIVGGLTSSSPQLLLENLTLDGGDGVAVAVQLPEGSTDDDAGNLNLRDVIVRGVSRITDGGSLVADRVAFRGTVVSEGARSVSAVNSDFSPPAGEPCVAAMDSGFTFFSDVLFGHCEVRVSNASLNVSHSIFDGLLTTAVNADCAPGTTCVAIDDSLIRRAFDGGEPALRFADGLATVSGTAIVGGAGTAVRVEGGEVTLDDCSILEPGRDGMEVSGGTVSLEKVAIEDYVGVAIALRGGGLSASQLTVRGHRELAVEGVVASTNTLLQVDDFLFETPGECAYRLEPRATVAVANGRIDTDEAGFCISAGSYDRSAFADRITQPTGTVVRETPAGE